MRAAILTFIACLITAPVQAQYGGGSGTKDDPYQIWTAAQLNAIGAKSDDWDKCFKLMADIDLKGLRGVPFNMIGVHASYGRPFSGVFNGNGKTIANLTCSKAGGTSFGLFAAVQGTDALVKNLRVQGAVVTAGTARIAGALVGYLHSGTISRCHADGGSVSGAFAVGGLVGIDNGTVIYCSSSASISASDMSGGGLVGQNTGVVAQCCSTGQVSARSGAGGLVGDNSGTVSDCYSTARAATTKGIAGGLVATNSGKIRNCYSAGPVSAPQGAGGLVGGPTPQGGVTGSFWDLQTSGLSTSGAGTGQNTAQMKTAATFTGWDSRNTWTILQGVDYPRLRWEADPFPTPVPTTIEKVSGDGQRALAGHKLGGLLTACVKDQDEVGMAGTHVEFTVTEGGGTVEPGSAVTDANGVAATMLTLGLTPGLNQVKATAGGVSVSFNITGLAPGYGGGTGEPNDPYQIWTAEQMNTIGANKDDWGQHFKLMADIDLSGFDGQWGRPAFNIIAPGSQNTFTGVFDGNGHTISQLTIRGGDYLGLFGQLKYPAEIKNLGLLDVDVTGSGYFVSYVGGLVGSNGTYLGSTKGGTITNCYSTGTVLGTGGQANFFGGLVGANYGEVSQCYHTGVVRGAWHIGGLVGGNGNFMFPQGVVRYCYSTGTVQCINQVVGGLVADNYGTVTCCYSTAGVSADLQSAPWTGGLVAANHGTVTNCYSSGAVRGTGWYAGGLTCWSMGTVTNCFWDTQTSGQTTSSGGTGKTMAEMQRASTFLAAGWDFVGETKNGTADIWWIDEGKGYPQLWWWRPAQGTYGGGSGTAQDPYQIRTAEQMNTIGASPGDWSKHFKLLADIDMSAFDGKDGRPAFNFIAPVVGGLEAYYWATPFSGVFDGNGHTILHLTITGENYRALFGYLESTAVVKNLGLVDVNVAATGSYGYVGAVGGYSFGLVTQCYSTGVVRSSGLHVGGLVGYNRGKIVQCYSTAATTADSWVGGLAGENWNTVSACYSTGAVTATSSWSGFAGGLVGGNYGPVTQCYSAGPVKGVTGVGGLVGGGRSADNVSQSLWDTQTSGQTASQGGTGKTTAEMQTAKTFLDAGWDFVGETANGTGDFWWIVEGKDYPHLWWEAAKK